MATDSELDAYASYLQGESEHQRDGQPALLRYDDFPEALVTQIVLLLDRAVGVEQRHGVVYLGMDKSGPSSFWRHINEQVRFRTGNFWGTGRSYRERYESHLRSTRLSTPERLYAIALPFAAIIALGIDPRDYQQFGILVSPADAVHTLNLRLGESRMGYRYENGRLFRIDSQHLHETITAPAIRLLQREGYDRALAEYISAYDHFGKSEFDDAIIDAQKAFESTMKIALERSGVAVADGEMAAQLIPKITAQIVPPYLRSHFESLRALMLAVPAVRNRPNVAHGGGSSEPETLNALASFALDVTGSAIKFIVERQSSSVASD
ncbi:MAG: hypothetical protein QM692_06450 [Thermomicrobiales bacterium]